MFALLLFALLQISAYFTLASSRGKRLALQQYGVTLNPPGMRLFTCNKRGERVSKGEREGGRVKEGGYRESGAKEG